MCSVARKLDMIEKTAPKTNMFVSARRLQGQMIQSSRTHLVVMKIRCNLFAFTHTHTQICMNAYIPHNISRLARKANGTAAEAKCQENLPACHFGQQVSQPRSSITTPTLQGIHIRQRFSQNRLTKREHKTWVSSRPILFWKHIRLTN
jgi:hypothetical protein